MMDIEEATELLQALLKIDRWEEDVITPLQG
ncbi:hypothetical protein VYU27_010542, partial [Nannochloropsis oceanica]